LQKSIEISKKSCRGYFLFFFGIEASIPSFPTILKTLDGIFNSLGDTFEVIFVIAHLGDRRERLLVEGRIEFCRNR